MLLHLGSGGHGDHSAKFFDGHKPCYDGQCSEVNSEKISFLITKYLFFIKFADIDFLCIPNLSEYFEKNNNLYIFFSSLKSYKYFKCNTIKNFHW